MYQPTANNIPGSAQAALPFTFHGPQDSGESAPPPAGRVDMLEVQDQTRRASELEEFGTRMLSEQRDVNRRLARGTERILVELRKEDKLN